MATTIRPRRSVLYMPGSNARALEKARKVRLPDGQVVVFTVTKVVPGDPAEATEQERAMLRRQLAQAHGIDDARAHVAALRKRFTIEVAEDRL